MRKGIEIDVSAADRARLEAIVADHNSRQSTSGGRGSSWRAQMAAAPPQ